MFKTSNPTIENAAMLSESARQVFNLLCYLERRWKIAFPSQQYIAKKVGITRVHCNRLIRQLEELGFIRKVTRPWHSSIYQIHPTMWHEVTRAKFFSFFKALRWICIALLMSPFPGYVTHILKSTEVLGICKSFSSNYSLSKSYSYIRLSKKGRRILEQNEYIHEATKSPWPSHLSEIKSLNLTKWGQIKLSIYPISAIHHADSKAEHVKSAHDPFKYFETLCNKYCFDNDLEVKFDAFYMLQERFGAVKPDAPMLLNQPVTKRHDLNQSPTINRQMQQTEKEDYYKKADNYGYRKPSSTYTNTRGAPTSYQLLERAKERIRQRQLSYSPEVLAKSKEMRERMGLNEDGTFKDPSVTKEEMRSRYFSFMSYRGM